MRTLLSSGPTAGRLVSGRLDELVAAKISELNLQVNHTHRGEEEQHVRFLERRSANNNLLAVHLSQYLYFCTSKQVRLY